MHSVFNPALAHTHTHTHTHTHQSVLHPMLTMLQAELLAQHKLVSSFSRAKVNSVLKAAIIDDFGHLGASAAS